MAKQPKTLIMTVLAEKNNLSRAETLGLLQEHGYVLPGGQNPLGVLRGQREGFGQYGRGGARKAASSAVLDARASGIRDLQNPSTMTAAERRVWEAERNWLEVQSGYNPYTAAAIERRRGVRIVSSDAPLTDDIRLRTENAYREAIITRGVAVSKISKEERVRRLEEWKANQREILAGRRTVIVGGKPVLQANRNTAGRRGQRGNGAYYNAGESPPTAAGGAGRRGGGDGGRIIRSDDGGFPRPDGYRGEENDPVFDSFLHRKVVEGTISDHGKPVGGHGYGKTPVGKTGTNHEFPQSWTDQDIAEAFYAALEDGVRTIKGNETVEIIHSYNGTETILRFSPRARHPEESVEFRPVRGRGVVTVTNKGGRIKRTIEK